jgi:hypothetical protein
MSFLYSPLNITPGFFLISGLLCNVLAFRFKYHDHDDLALPETIDPIGSHVVIGDFPHWCLGNIEQCVNGFSIDFSIKLEQRPGDAPDTIILSNGGKLFYSEGFYLLQKFGDQYEAGVSKGGQNWRVNFRLVADFFIHVFITWDEISGLTAFVDEQEFKQEQYVEVDYDEDIFDTFNKFLVGIDKNEEPILEDEWFEIRSIDFHDKVIPRTGSNFRKFPLLLCFHQFKFILIFISIFNIRH